MCCAFDCFFLDLIVFGQRMDWGPGGVGRTGCVFVYSCDLLVVIKVGVWSWPW